jgi:transposase
VRRGQIIQRILVDGWSPAEAAAFLGVGERQVVQWVAAYRRNGMASLRADPASERAPSRWARHLRAVMARFVAGLRGGKRHPPPAPCLEWRQKDDAGARR